MSDTPLRTPTLLSVVAPVYDEEELVEEFVARATRRGRRLRVRARARQRRQLGPHARAARPHRRAPTRACASIHLSRNFGHQAALTAGLEHAVGDVVAMIDADLQDPPELIPEMIAQWSQGADVVYAVRKQREGETAFKLATASWFYKLFDKLAQVDLEPNSGDFRLLDRRALDALLAMTERSRFLRGMTVWVGFTPDRRLLPARRAPRRRDQVHAAQDAALLARRDRLLLAPAAAAGHLRGAALGGRGLHRDPGRDRAAHRRLLPAGLRLDHDRDPAARRHPADRARRDRRVRRAHLRRGQAPPAVHRARGAQPPDRARPRRRGAPRGSSGTAPASGSARGPPHRRAPGPRRSAAPGGRRAPIPLRLPCARSLAPARACLGRIAAPARAAPAPRAKLRRLRRAGACPYCLARRSSASAPRACCASPRPSRSTRRATCTSPTSSAMWCRSSPPQAPRDRVGLLRRRPRPVRADRRARHRRRRATCTWSTRATTGSRSSTANGNFITAWGHHGSELGEFQLRLLAGPHPAARRGHRGGGQLRLRGRQRQRPHRALQPGRRRSDAVGLLRQRPRPVLLPARRRGERKRGDRHRRRQPPHREVRPRRRLTRAPSDAAARDPAVRLPLRRRARRGRRRVRGRRHQPPRRQARRRSSSFARSVGRLRLKTRPARLPARRSPATRRATPTSPTPPTTASRCSTPNGNYLRTLGISARGPGQRDRAAWPGGRPDRQAARLRHRRQPRSRRSPPGSDAYAGAWTAAGGHRAGFNAPRESRVDPRGSVYVADPGNAATRAAVGRRHVPVRTRRARPTSAARSSTAPARWPCAAGPDETYVADTGHNRVLVYGPEGSLAREVGRRRRRRRGGQRQQANSTNPMRVAVDGAGDVYVADTGNNRIVKLSARQGRC